MFLRGLCCIMFSNYLVWALFGLELTHITHSIHIYIYTICGLFLQQKTATIENILLFVWSISIIKDRRFADQYRPRL